MGLLSELERLINERGSAAILRERLALFVDKVRNLEEDRVQMQKRITTLEKECSDLRRQLESKTVTEQFVEHKGAFFKRKPDGKYHEAVFCLTCKVPMGSMGNVVEYTCPKCHGFVNFCGYDLDRILKELPT